MELKPYQQQIIELMVQQELKLAELYQALMESVPSLVDLWSKTRGEELQHVQWVEHLGNKIKSGGILFQEDKVRANALQSFLTYLDSIINRVKGNKLTDFEALVLASDVEDSLLERKVFDHFQHDSPEIKVTLERLRIETQEHGNQMREIKRKYSGGKG